jgi:hypothetical protein
MNAERLHKILNEVKKDFDGNKLLNQLQQMQKHLQSQISQPTQAAHQTFLSNSLETIYSLLENSETNNFSPNWTSIIHELGGQDKYGRDLMNKIQSIFNSNQLTPTIALQDVDKLISSYKIFVNAVNQTVSGFTSLKIGKEELKEGQCELEYSIPRLFVENKLSQLTKEVTELGFILNQISEVVTGEKQDYEVKTISSSDYLLYIIIGLKVGEIISNVIERILSNYKTVLEIKQLRNQLKERGIPDEQTTGIDAFANEKLKKEIEVISKEIIQEHFNGSDERKNELLNGLTIAFNKIANRIDKGFNISFRVEQLSAPEENEELSDDQKNAMESIRQIQANMNKIKYLENSGAPILELEEGSEENETE